jgi:serine/threonine-protein kinase
MKSEFTDTVRQSTAAHGELRDKVRRLYPQPETMRHLLEQDTERFLAALERATGRFLRVGEDQDKTIKDFPEPVGPLARQYILKEIGLEEAALELGLSDSKVLRLTIRSSDRLRQLGLGPLATGATIKRETWESLDRFISPFQETAGMLDLGAPQRVK